MLTTKRIYRRQFTFNCPTPHTVTLRRTIVSGRNGWMVEPTRMNGKKILPVHLKKIGKKWFARLTMSLEPIASGKSMADAWLSAVNQITKPDAGSNFRICWDYSKQLFVVRHRGGDYFESPDFEPAYDFACRARAYYKEKVDV